MSTKAELERIALKIKADANKHRDAANQLDRQACRIEMIARNFTEEAAKAALASILQEVPELVEN